MSTGMLTETGHALLECRVPQLEGFFDNIVRFKASLAVNHGDVMLSLRNPSGLFCHCECSELRTKKSLVQKSQLK